MTKKITDPAMRKINYPATRKPHPFRSLADRFWEKVKKGDGCWEWQAGFFADGYGLLRKRGEGMARAHRISYELNVGEIPAGLYVLHICDNPSCVRPDHLFLGTQADNVADMTAKGRGAQKLTEADVIEIRKRYRFGSGAILGREFGITHGMIWAIVKRKTWKHIA